MIKKIIASIFVLAICSVLPNQLLALEVSIGNYSTSSNFITIPVLISGGEQVKDMGGLIVVGNGGTLASFPAVPTISAIDYTGSIWTGAPGGFVTSIAAPLPKEIAFPSVSLNTSGQSVAASGLLLNFTLDLTGFPVGSTYGLSLQYPSSQDTTFTLDNGNEITPTFVNGSISIVPEPSSLMLVVAALATCGFWAVLRR